MTMRTPLAVYAKLMERLAAWLDWRIEVSRMRFGESVRTP
jgi:hypothetical protein